MRNAILSLPGIITATLLKTTFKKNSKKDIFTRKKADSVRKSYISNANFFSLSSYTYIFYFLYFRVISGIQAIIVSCISLRTMIICKDILHDTDPVLETYIYPASGYFIYDLVVMYQGFSLRLESAHINPETPQSSSSVSSRDANKNTNIDDKKVVQSSLMLFLNKELFMVLHHVILECVGLPVVLVGCYVLKFVCLQRPNNNIFAKASV